MILSDSLDPLIISLIATILVLIYIVVKLNMVFYKEKKGYKKKLNSLGKITIQVNKNKQEQSERIKLSKEIDSKLNSSDSYLFTAIFELNRELFEIISKNNLN